MKNILSETYSALSINSNYLVVFGVRTALDRTFNLIVGDKGNFKDTLKAMKDGKHISQQHADIIDPLIEAGHASAHRGWVPSNRVVNKILDAMEYIIEDLMRTNIKAGKRRRLHNYRCINSKTQRRVAISCQLSFKNSESFPSCLISNGNSSFLSCFPVS
ncbi:DUF4145 domain-containing protein [Terasakiella sp. SH-1]|uniref:DUF4145 domain-containing protein n=1 Tax=Terasakiella sp. SH-1 TaxID=2560057 RepID=UPI0010738640|nr:DUF4145 domain-containing protein [Terasakiella sp. SH-1]